MEFRKVLFNCQRPAFYETINRNFAVIRVTLTKGTKIYNELLSESKILSNDVSSAPANESSFSRNDTRKLADSFGELISEKAWLNYINNTFGKIASTTPFEEASAQIELQLDNDYLIEVRSSFIIGGVTYDICSDKSNFKNIGPYSNYIKPGKIQKIIYCGVLFETPKNDLLTANNIILYLVGSSTWNMMMNIGINTKLNASDAISISPGNYKVVYYKDSMDINQFKTYMESLGY